MTAHRPDDETIRYRIDFADAGFAITNNEFGDGEHRELLLRVAAEEITAGHAVDLTCERYGVWIDDSVQPEITDWGDYEIDGRPVLRSRLRDATDSSIVSAPERLRAVELDISRLRTVELAIRPVEGRFDFVHFAEIHRRLFSDVFGWAGQQRVGPQTAMIRFAPDAVAFAPADPSAPMVKYTYSSGPAIAEELTALFSQLEYLAQRESIERDELLSIMAELGADLFAIHPFRDGNARAIWVYGVQLDESLGMSVDFSQMLEGAHLHKQVLPATYRYQATGDFGGYFMALDSALSQAAVAAADVD